MSPREAAASGCTDPRHERGRAGLSASTSARTRTSASPIPVNESPELRRTGPATLHASSASGRAGAYPHGHGELRASSGVSRAQPLHTRPRTTLSVVRPSARRGVGARDPAEEETDRRNLSPRRRQTRTSAGSSAARRRGSSRCRRAPMESCRRWRFGRSDGAAAAEPRRSRSISSEEGHGLGRRGGCRDEDAPNAPAAALAAVVTGGAARHGVDFGPRGLTPLEGLPTSGRSIAAKTRNARADSFAMLRDTLERRKSLVAQAGSVHSLAVSGDAAADPVLSTARRVSLTPSSA